MPDDEEAILGELLVLRCRRGDADAWRQLVRLFERRLLYYIRRFVDDERDAWDVLQQTWLGVIGSLPSLREPRSLRPWLYRIARLQAISHRRRTDRAIEFTDDDDLLDVPDDNDPALQNVDAELIHNALSDLPLPQREVLTLHFLEDLSVDEIAQVQGVPPGTVKSRMYHAKRALRAAMEKREVR